MDKKGKNILSTVLWALVALVLVWFCLKAVDWEQFGAALEACRWEWVLFSMLLGVLCLYFRGIRWRMLVAPFDPAVSRINCFDAYNICMAVNLAVPRAGEIARLGYVVKHSRTDENGHRRLSFDKALGTVLTERAWDVLVVLFATAAVLLVMWKRYGSFAEENASVLSRSAGFWWMAGGLALLCAGLIAVLRLLRDKGGFWSKVWDFLVGIGKGALSFRHMRHAWLFLLFTLLIWTLYWLECACIIQALRDIPAFASLTMADAFLLMMAGSLSSVVPVPGGFGAYHSVVAGLMSRMWNIPMGTGMIFATLCHESQVIVYAVCGLVSYLHESFFQRKS